MIRYRLTESAEADLVDILQYIRAQSGVSRARDVHERFVDAFEALATDPQIGHRKPELTADPIRWWTVYRFLVVYDAGAHPIDILRIIHGARDIAVARSNDREIPL